MLDLAKLQKQPIPEDYYQQSEEKLIQVINKAKKKLGTDLVLLAHHYQKDEVVQFADEIGDSLELARKISRHSKAKLIVFCGVHFMAETADILANDQQKVILPDITAGCPMADMATAAEVKVALEKIQKLTGQEILPITYVNSSAEVKAVVGLNDGFTITSGNAQKIMKLALQQDKLILFLPDQYLGLNTARELGVSSENIAQWSTKEETLSSLENLSKLKMVVWNGYCSVHRQFSKLQVKRFRELFPGIKVIVHPECLPEVVQAADEFGSTAKIIKYVHELPSGSRVAIGTDNNLVGRLKKEVEAKGIFVHFLNPMACSCQTMNRIDLPHLAWVLSQLSKGKIVNQIKVLPQTAVLAKKALDQMLAIS